MLMSLEVCLKVFCDLNMHIYIHAYTCIKKVNSIAMCLCQKCYLRHILLISKISFLVKTVISCCLESPLLLW